MSEWPHQFTPEGREYQMGERDGLPVIARPMICIHCDKKFISGLESRPPDPCPARVNWKEMKRLRCE